AREPRAAVGDHGSVDPDLTRCHEIDDAAAGGAGGGRGRAAAAARSPGLEEISVSRGPGAQASQPRVRTAAARSRTGRGVRIRPAVAAVLAARVAAADSVDRAGAGDVQVTRELEVQGALGAGVGRRVDDAGPIEDREA